MSQKGLIWGKRKQPTNQPAYYRLDFYQTLSHHDAIRFSHVIYYICRSIRFVTDVHLSIKAPLENFILYITYHLIDTGSKNSKCIMHKADFNLEGQMWKTDLEIWFQYQLN